MPTYLAIFGCAVLILVEVWVSARMLLQGQKLLAEQATTHYEFLMQKLDVQPPLADEKPQAVLVSIKPSEQGAKGWSQFMEFEESQRATLKEFEE